MTPSHPSLLYVLDHYHDPEQIVCLTQLLPSLCGSFRVLVVSPQATIPTALRDISHQFPDVEIIALDIPAHASWLLRIRTLVALFRELRVTHAHVVAHHSDSQLATLIALRITRTPHIILVIEGVTAHDSSTLRQRWHAYVLQIPHRIVVYTSSAKRLLEQHYAINDTQIAIVPVGVDDQLYQLSRVTPHTRAMYHIPAHGHLVGFYAPFTHAYGADLLIRAMATLWQFYPDTQVVIAGDGPQATQLHALATQSLYPSQIHFVGTIDDVAGFFAGVDIVAFPARHCTMPLSLLIAMALERPVIGSAISNIQDVIEANGSGLLTRPDDPDALASSIMRLINDHALRISLAFNARTRVSQRFRKERWLAAIHQCHHPIAPR
ncbi:MAG: hypothetical protein RL076_2299 [Chloroflexota bacterium]